MRKYYRERAEKSVHTRLVFEEIVKAEKLKATKKEVEAKIKAYAEQIGSTYEEFSKQLQDSDRYYFENQAVTDSLLELLKKENTIA